jgi:SAM-dependent methyltransferase
MNLNHDLLALVRCPHCRGTLAIADGPPPELKCRDCSTPVPISQGIPRLAGDTYAASFGRQWNRYDVMRPDEDHATFQVKTGISASELAGKLVLDAGCGGGRYARLVGANGGRVLGVDLSAAVIKAAELCRDLPNVTIIQADLLDLSLAPKSFDLVYSIGVLHHTPDPRKAFGQIANKVKPGGKLAVWLYRRNTRPQEWLNSGLRSITTRLPAPVLEPVCAGMGVLGSIPGLKQTLNKVVNFSNHPDWTLRICDNFDWYAPRFQSHHSIDELMQWFAEEGFDQITELEPARNGRVYNWAYQNDLVIGSGVNVVGRKR